MKSFVKFGALMLLAAGFAGSMASCDDYPAPVNPPVINKTYNISGVVSDRSGAPIAGATITRNDGTKVTTDERGFFVFADVNPGEYKLEASAEGKIPATTVVNISGASDGVNAVWNVMLLNVDAAKEIKFKPSVGVSKKDAMETGNISGNKNGNVEVDVDIPADAFEGTENDEDIVITITPIYDESQASARAKEHTMLAGAYLYCSNPKIKLKNGQKITITFYLDKKAVETLESEKYDGSKFVHYKDYTKDGNYYKVHADQLNTTYALFADVNFAETHKSNALTFNPATVDNLNGNSSVQITACTYTYGVGTSINIPGSTTKLQALLIEAIARKYGAIALKNLPGVYPVGVNLPVGCKFTITGYQNTADIKATCAGDEATAQSFGDVKIDTNVTVKADHNGGSI